MTRKLMKEKHTNKFRYSFAVRDFYILYMACLPTAASHASPCHDFPIHI